MNVLHWSFDLQLTTLRNHLSTSSFHKMNSPPIDQRKSKMTSRITLCNLMLVPSTCIWENFAHNTQEANPFSTACNSSVYYQSQAVEVPTQLKLRSNQHKDEIEQCTEVPDIVRSRYKLHSLVVKQLNHNVVTLLKNRHAGHRKNTSRVP